MTTEPNTNSSGLDPLPSAKNTAQSILEELAFEALKEKRRARRWGIFFKSLFLVYFIAILVMVQTNGVTGTTGDHTALIDLDGVIGLGQDIDADTVATGLDAAFKNENVKGVILRINSPGGSAVQAGYINDEITRLKKKHPKIPIYAVITDMCASGGYYAAVATDKIYANKASIVGSIGVLFDSFGFVDSLDKLGVERRLITAGERKGMLDPFLPLNQDDKDHIKALVDQVHEQFIEVVKAGRGDRLSDAQNLFTGLIWSGEEAKKLGLIDELGSPGYVAREVIGAEKIVNYTPKRDLLEQLSGRLGATLARSLASQIAHQIKLPELLLR